MNNHYTTERNIQIVISLLKKNGIRYIVASPGATDISLNASLQHDSWFVLYSCIDERSAAYMACGIAAETGEAVAITCTGATSSRNYMPGLTEAYYRQLPILAITCCRSNAFVGHYVDQVTDRSILPNDIANISVYAQSIKSPEDEWDVTNKVNKAILGLKWNGGGPCHINLETTYSSDFSVESINNVRSIQRFSLEDSEFPQLSREKNIGIFVGAHTKWSKELTDKVDEFCQIYNSVVFCDHTSNYEGKYKVLFPLISDQFENTVNDHYNIDILIHIGFISNVRLTGKEIWRVSKDGELRNPFRNLKNIFQMSEEAFFNFYTKDGIKENNIRYKLYSTEYNELYNRIPNLPFSNLWVAKFLTPLIPANSVLHLGIRNSVRSWCYFNIDSSIRTYCNTGGFGIDGGISSLIGASIINQNKLYFGVFGDLLFYYDMNSLGNRHIKNNLRILVINNGLGQEFKNYSCHSSYQLGIETDEFIAAKGHYGQHPDNIIIEKLAESLNFKYIKAASKEEFLEKYQDFVNPKIGDKSIIFEVITHTSDESEAYELITTLDTKSKILKKSKDVLLKDTFKPIKKIIQAVVK